MNISVVQAVASASSGALTEAGHAFPSAGTNVSFAVVSTRPFSSSSMQSPLRLVSLDMGSIHSNSSRQGANAVMPDAASTINDAALRLLAREHNKYTHKPHTNQIQIKILLTHHATSP